MTIHPWTGLVEDPGSRPGRSSLDLVRRAEMLALAELTQPGPFGMRTHEMGTYLGIRREGKLVAMAGERLEFANGAQADRLGHRPTSADESRIDA